MDNETEIDIRQIVGLLRRQFRLILTTFIVVISLAAVALFSITPIYTATTLILVDPSRKNLLDPSLQGTSSSTDSLRVDSEVEIVDSDRVLMQTVSDLRLVSDSEFGVHLGLRGKLLVFLRMSDGELPTGEQALAEVLRTIKQKVSARRRGLTYLIALDAESADPNKAALLANTVAETYIQIQIQSKIESTLAARDVIRRQIEEAEQGVVSAEKNLNGFVVTNLEKIVAATGRQDLAQMGERLNAINFGRAQATKLISDLNSNLSDQNWADLASRLESEAARELERQREQLADSLSNTVRDSDEYVDLRAQLDEIEKSLSQQARQEVASLQSSIAENEQKSTEIRQQLSSTVLRADLPPDILATIYGLQQVSTKATSQYQALLARMQDLDTEAELQIADSRIVSPALAPTTPSSPKIKLVLALAGLFALGFGVGLAFLFENFVGGFTSEEQLEAVTRFPLAAVIPRQRLGDDMISVADYVVEEPLSAYAESIRKLRAFVDRSVRDKSLASQSGKNAGKVIMVSSSLPVEGKSTIAISLARTYALAGDTALIIDCDLRKPSVHRQLGISSKNGLADYVAGNGGKVELKHILGSDRKTDLVSIVGSRKLEFPADQLLTKKSFADVIKTARSQFDYVILDSAPVVPVVDASYLAQFADAIVFIARWAKTPQRVAIKALKTIDDAKLDETPIVTALNQQEGSRGYYYSRYSS